MMFNEIRKSKVHYTNKFSNMSMNQLGFLALLHNAMLISGAHKITKTVSLKFK